MIYIVYKLVRYEYCIHLAIYHPCHSRTEKNALIFPYTYTTDLSFPQPPSLRTVLTEASSLHLLGLCQPSLSCEPSHAYFPHGKIFNDGRQIAHFFRLIKLKSSLDDTRYVTEMLIIFVEKGKLLLPTTGYLYAERALRDACS
jgi:hypothetical protein